MKRNRVVRRPMLIKPLVFFAVIGAWIDLTPYSAYGAAVDTPCSANSESRQLDFWLGNWSVTYPGTPGSSSSRVYTELDQCLLMESWDGGKGHRGENMFAYSADDKGWRGMFADNQGRVHALEGKAAAGSAEFFGPSRDANGKAVLNRIRIVRVSADRVEQSWEKSADSGVTWTMEFRGQYSRKNP